MLRPVLLFSALLSLGAISSNIEQYNLFRQAYQHHAAGELAEAMQQYQQLIDQNSRLHREASFNLACATYSMKRYSQAAKLFATLPQGDRKLSSMAKYNRGNALAMTGLINGNSPKPLKKALDLYRRVLIDDPENNDARINYEIVWRALRPHQPQPPSPPQQNGNGAPEQHKTEPDINNALSRMLLENTRQKEIIELKKYFSPLPPRPSNSSQPDW